MTNDTKHGAGGTLANAVRVESAVEIRRPPAEVFAYITNATRWPEWHPATAAVRDAPPRPLIVGETVLEVIAFAGRRSEALWTVCACRAPDRWEIATDTPRGAARIVYELFPAAIGSLFRRSLDYRSRRWPWRALDSTVTRSILVRQSARALANLKRILESGST